MDVILLKWDFFSYCHNVFTGYFYKPINYYNCTLYLAKKKKKSMTDWKLGECAYNCALCTAHWKPWGQGQWKTCLIPSNRCKHTFRGFLQRSSYSRMFLCGSDFFFHKCNQLLKILLHKHIFPWKLQWLCAMLQELQNRLFYISDLSVFICCLKVNHKTLQLMQSCNTVPDVNSSGIFKSQMLTFLSFWNPSVLSFIF